mmetsp:Transcript_8434/g.19695  ORF Transcript_8434/g.19695 Transcript_8434/m.19695 type:complete len:100 (-) Transcript_8434:2056-2355(-)
MIPDKILESSNFPNGIFSILRILLRLEKAILDPAVFMALNESSQINLENLPTSLVQIVVIMTLVISWKFLLSSLQAKSFSKKKLISIKAWKNEAIIWFG